MSYQAFTIDGPTSRDLDDAVWVERSGNCVNLHVYVADPAAAVPVGSPDDERALRMIETRYYASGNDPMLPRAISEDAASLRPGKLRKTLLVNMQFDAEGRRTDASVQCDIPLRSAAQLHYGQVLEIRGRPDHALHGQVLELDRLAQQLLARRRGEGALALYDLSTGLLTSEEGTLRWAETDRSTLGQVIVQEAMIAANTAVAEMCLHHAVPVLFRNHEASVASPPREEIRRWLSEMVSAPREVAVQRARVLETVLGRARYGTELRGHFGLALGAYMHVTSPIRRLADLLNHRQIRAFLLGLPMPYDRAQIDEIAGRINEFRDAQRDARIERFKEKADRLLLRRAAGGMEQLEPKAFSRLVKIAARGQDAPDDALCAEVVRRCRQQTLQPLDAYYILWRDGLGWDVTRSEVVKFLEACPHDAVSVVGISMAVEAETAAVLSPATPEGAAFESTIRRGPLEFVGRGPNKKRAEQAAVLALFRGMSGLPPEPETSPAAPAQPKPKAMPPLPNPAAIDPISELQLYCQALGAESPSYVFADKKERGVPLFRCEVSALGKMGASEFRASKKEAKKEAAARYIQAMQGGHVAGTDGRSATS